VLKALAEYLDLSLGDLLEGIVLHAFEGQAPFGTGSLAQIARLKDVYGLTLTAADCHLLVEAPPRRPLARRPLAQGPLAQRPLAKQARASGRASSRGNAGRRKARAAVA
jgi:hypothetical protein